MNYQISEYFEVYCHHCEQWLELGELCKKGNVILCVYHIYGYSELGYVWDIPEKFKKYIKEI